MSLLSEDRKRSIGRFEKYSEEKNSDECLEYKEKKRIEGEGVKENFRKMRSKTDTIFRIVTILYL